MTVTPEGKERRQSVRLRPVADLPATARLTEANVELPVWDVSVGGLAVAAPPQTAAGLERETRHRLHLDLGSYGAFDLEVEVRHRSTDADGTVGMQMIDPPQEAITAIGRYIGELLERGALS